jgi:Sulfotransferase family
MDEARVEPVIIFLHLPKTGGSTLARVIKRQYRPESVLRLYESEFGEELEQLRPFQLERLRAVMGHFYFGAHNFLSRPARYMTLIREPVERIISHYYFVRRSPGHEFYEPANEFSLKDFVEYCSIETERRSDNDQTRQLAGVHGRGSSQTDAAELLEIAQRNLAEHFSVVGITEEFDRSLILARRTFGWKHVFYTSRNVTRQRPHKDELTQETLEVIEAHNDQDLQLYRCARDLLTEHIRREGSGFEDELRAFRRLNRLYGHLSRVASAVTTSAGATIPLAARPFKKRA